MSEHFDLQSLGKDPMVDGPEAVALANALAAAKPANAPPNVATLAGKMISSAEVVAAALASTEGGDGAATVAADHRMDVAAGAFHDRLESYGRIAAEGYARAARCAALVELLFPDGLGFLKWNYAAEWAGVKGLFDRINQQNVRDEVASLAGEDLLNELQAAYANYGTVLGITAAPKPGKPGVASPLGALKNAIGAYCRAVLGMIDLDPSLEPAVAAALAPRLERQKQFSKKVSDGMAKKAAAQKDPPKPADTPKAS